MGLHLHRFTIRQKLQDPQPAVTSVAMPPSSQGLGIEHHLKHLLPRRVLIHTLPHVHFIAPYSA